MVHRPQQFLFSRPAFWLTPELNNANAAPVERDTRYSTAPDFQGGIVARRHGHWVTPT
jgi:hypothetical protein